MRSTWWLGLLTLCACAPPAGLEAKLWTVEDFLRLAPQRKDLGGWRADQLVTLEGAPIPFRSPPHGAVEVKQGRGYGLTLFPAFAQGEPAAFLITEIWFAHPRPWLQPAWLMVSSFSDYAVVEGTKAVFPVDAYGSFYSPFWVAEFVLAPGAAENQYTSSKAVLDARLPMQAGPLVYSAVAPADGGAVVGEGEAGPVHPWALREDVGLDGGEPMSAKAPDNGVAWIDGREVPYLGLGAGRVKGYGQLPMESELFTFAVGGSDGGRELLPIPAVLPQEPFASSYVRRVDVLLPPTAAVFVPQDRAALAEALGALGVRHVSAPVDASTARAKLGVVIRDVACLGLDAGLGACALLDSPGAIEPLGPAYVIPTGTTLAIDVAQAGGRLE